MKKIICIFLICLLSIGLYACSSTAETKTEEENPAEIATNNDSSILVAYFSATGNTAKVAQDISEELSAKLYEITPVEPYTEDDLGYNSDNSRSNTENNDDSARPEIFSEYSDMGSVKTIFLGYPIWYGKAPKIIYTFLESYDLSGKTIIPFCTSGSSDIGPSVKDLEPLAKGATFEDGMRFSEDASKEEVDDWVDSLNLK